MTSTIRRRGGAALPTLLLLGLAGAAGAAQAAPALTAGCSGDFVAKAAARYSNFSNGSPGAREIQLGLPDFSVQTTGDTTWAGGKPIEFRYDGVSTLTTKVGPSGAQVTVSHTIGSLGGQRTSAPALPH